MEGRRYTLRWRLGKGFRVLGCCFFLNFCSVSIAFLWGLLFFFNFSFFHFLSSHLLVDGSERVSTAIS